MKKLNIQDMMLLAKQHGGRCLSLKYINNLVKLVWECAEGHRWPARPKNVKSGVWCPKCSKNKKLPPKKR